MSKKRSLVKKTVKIRHRPSKMSVAISAKQEDLIYEKDFSRWAIDQAKFLRNGEFLKLDMDNLIEEIEDLSRREKDKLTSYLENLLMHMLKVKFQPERHTASWNNSIKVSSHKAQRTLAENPSLKSKLKEIVEDAYFSARLKASSETDLAESSFPKKCPWDLKDIFPTL